ASEAAPLSDCRTLAARDEQRPERGRSVPYREARCRPARCRRSALSWVVSPLRACRARAVIQPRAPFGAPGRSRPDALPASACPELPGSHAFPGPRARTCRSDTAARAAALSEPGAPLARAFPFSPEHAMPAAALSEPGAPLARAFPFSPE